MMFLEAIFGSKIWKYASISSVYQRLKVFSLYNEVDPVALEDVGHFDFEEIRVGEHLALAAVDALLLVVFKHGIQVIDSQGHGRGLRCYYPGPVRLERRFKEQYPFTADRYPITAQRGCFNRGSEPAREAHSRAGLLPQWGGGISMPALEGARRQLAELQTVAFGKTPQM